MHSPFYAAYSVTLSFDTTGLVAFSNADNVPPELIQLIKTAIETTIKQQTK